MKKEEFKAYFDEYFDSLRSYLYYRCGDEALATDLAQDAFMKIWEKRNQIELTYVKSLLYKIAGDLLVNHWRKNNSSNQYMEQLELEYDTNNPEEALKYQELKTTYQTALADLPENQRVVFLMSRKDELTYKEIAGRLELSVKAVEKRMSSALGALKKALKYS